MSSPPEKTFYHLSPTVPRRPCTFNPLLYSSRLTLTLHDPRNEADTIFALHCANHPSVNAVHENSRVFTPEKWHAFRQATKLLPSFTPNRTPVYEPAFYAVRLGANNPDGERVGAVLLASRHEHLPPDLGWSTLPAHQRQGFASEAAKRLLRYFEDEFQGGFRNADPPLPLGAILNESNAGSVGVARKTGMVKMGKVRALFPRGKTVAVYGVPSAGFERRAFTTDTVIHLFGVGNEGINVIKMLFGDDAFVSDDKDEDKEAARVLGHQEF